MVFRPRFIRACLYYRMPEKPRLTILYGSQTGQAKAIAEEIHENSHQNGITASIFCLSLTDKKFCIDKETYVVFVVSTTGDGDPPDTVRKFYRRINKKTLPSNYLENLKFAFLALGDSNYTNFCNCGKNIEKRLLGLGAKPFYPTGYADDAVGLEVVVEPWIEALWSAVSKESQSKKAETFKPNSAKTDMDDNGKYQINTKDGEKVKDKVDKDVSERDQSNLNGVATDEERWNSPSKELNGKGLKIPHCPQPFLQLAYYQDQTVDLESQPLQNKAPFPSAVSDLKLVRVLRAEQFTREDSVKTALELVIDIRSLQIDYQPGDTFGIVCPNDEQAVETLIKRLKIEDVADLPFTMTVSENTTKQNAALPDFIPPTSTLRHIFKTCIDIKSVPKKTLLRSLVEYTENEAEKRRLQELCSAQGAKEYMKFVREPYTGLLDILKAFPSCRPPVERLIELLPRLQPRAYSVSSSSLQNKNIASFIFNITVINGLDGVTEKRTGLCTGWLEQLTSSIRCKKCNQCDGCGSVEFEDLGKEVQKLDLNKAAIQIPIYWRQETNFKLPSDESVPVIMIGPGTGVAPFISFLSHREVQKRRGRSRGFGDSYLFFGCRHKERDFLYRDKIEVFLTKGILTKLFVSFSRDDVAEEFAPRYVQDNLRLQKDLIMPLITEKKAAVYICGDAKNMAKNVFQMFVELFQSHQNMTSQQAMAYIKRLRDEGRYLEDIWT